MRFKLADVLVLLVALAAPAALAEEAARLTPELAFGEEMAMGAASPLRAYSAGLHLTWEEGQAVGFRVRALTGPSVTDLQGGALDFVARAARADNPLYGKLLVGGSLFNPRTAPDPLRLHMGAEAGLKATQAGLGFELGLLAQVEPPLSSTPWGGSIGFRLAILLGAPSPGDSASRRPRPVPMAPAVESSRDEPGALPSGPGPGPVLVSGLPPASPEVGGLYVMGERDVIRQILLFPKPLDIATWWDSGPKRYPQQWTHPLSGLEKKYLKAMRSPDLDEAVRMRPPADPERLTPEEAREAEQWLGKGPDVAQRYANLENRRRIIAHYVLTNPATIELEIGLYELARDTNPLHFALERGWQMARGREMFTEREVSRLGAAVEFFTSLALYVATNNVAGPAARGIGEAGAGQTRPYWEGGEAGPAEWVDPVRVDQTHPYQEGVKAGPAQEGDTVRVDQTRPYREGGNGIARRRSRQPGQPPEAGAQSVPAEAEESLAPTGTDGPPVAIRGQAPAGDAPVASLKRTGQDGTRGPPAPSTTPPAPTSNAVSSQPAPPPGRSVPADVASEDAPGPSTTPGEGEPGATLATDAVGPGEWITDAREWMPADSRAYQAQVTGHPEGYAYVVRGVKMPDGKVTDVKFDGFVPGKEFQECKGPGYTRFLDKKKPGQFQWWFEESQTREGGMVSQAMRQMRAAGGRLPVRWYVAEREVAGAIRRLLERFGAEEVEVIWQPFIAHKGH